MSEAESEAEPVTRSMPGARIRQLREQRGMGVRRLAALIGVSAATVSQVERGINDPSLTTLRRVAEALQVPLFNLFQDGVADDFVIQRADEHLEVGDHDEMVVTRVTPVNGSLEILEALLEPGAASSPEPHAHPSSEAIVVKSGTLDVEVNGVSHRLRRGDSCQFDSRLPHRYLNATSRRVCFLIAVTPPSY